MADFNVVFKGNLNGYDFEIVKAEWHTPLTGMEKYWYNGYVYLPKSHKWLKRKTYWDIDCEVHGGLTFKEGNKIGFDCNHADDSNKVQNFEYVLNEIANLIKQAKEAQYGKK